MLIWFTVNKICSRISTLLTLCFYCLVDLNPACARSFIIPFFFIVQVFKVSCNQSVNRSIYKVYFLLFISDIASSNFKVSEFNKKFTPLILEPMSSAIENSFSSQTLDIICLKTMILKFLDILLRKYFQ